MWKIEPSVQRGDKWAAEPAKQRNMDPIQVAMNDVEFFGAPRNALSKAVSAEVGSIGGRLNRNGFGEIGTSSALVFEPPLANNVTLSPKPTSSSVSQETTRSVPP